MSAVLDGLTSAQVDQAHRESATSGRRPGSRTYWQIARTNIFTFYNNVLFLIGAGLLALDRVNDAVVSVGLGLLNAVISSYQEMRAKKKLDALRLLHLSAATVVRDGVEIQVPPDDLVRGDLVRVVAGDQVVVDGPVAGPGRLEVDESLLTGESRAVVKVTGDRLLSGSFVVSGEAYQRAEAVGPDSHASQLTAAAQQWRSTMTPLQRRIDVVVRAVIATVGLISLAIFAQASMEGLPLVRMVQLAAVLSGLVPYGLFFMVAVSYATGAAELARRGALVQQVNAVESLSNVDVVCTDKTGTLTTGRLSLHTVLPLGGLDEARARQLVGTFAHSVHATNTTTAALAAALPGPAGRVVEEVPFVSARRWSALTLDAAATSDAPTGTYVLGAVQSLADALPAGTVDEDSALGLAVRSYAGRGLRVLVLARSVAPRATLYDGGEVAGLPPLTPLALVVLADELRPYVRETLADLREARVEVKVVSGDDPRTVAALVAQIGLAEHHPLSGAELAAMSATDFDEAVREGTVFGRIAPEQKEQIVDALIRGGRYVAMIGDGVNDVRSLKRAQVGVAMQSGSGVARDVADLVLLGDSFAALPLARHEGRRIISGLTTALKLFLSRVAASMVIILGVAVLGLGFPYEPAQVALTLFTVGVPSLFLAWWARPQEPDQHLIANLARFVVPVAVVTGVAAVALYAGLSTLLSRGLERGIIPDGAVAQFEVLTGLSASDPTFIAATATLVAQTGLAMFTSVTAFVLVVFVEPPIKLFTGWTGVSPDKRPAWLALALLAVFTAVLYIPPASRYFDLVQPGGFMVPVVLAFTVVWFVVLRTAWRHRLLERALGLDHTAAPGPRASD